MGLHLIVASATPVRETCRSAVISSAIEIPRDCSRFAISLRSVQLLSMGLVPVHVIQASVLIHSEPLGHSSALSSHGDVTMQFLVVTFDSQIKNTRSDTRLE